MSASAEASTTERPEVGIHLTDVSLRFRLHRRDPVTLKDWVLRKLGSAGPDASETLQALSGVDLRITEGERVGIIGKNGAGKSTLLRVISRIYRPSAGSADVKGSLVPLFQVGLGFQPGLTCVENVRQAGAILGMASDEVEEEIPRILAFAELENFAHVPIKYLSTGMWMRLAFTTATSVAPDILVLDEVFAAGDAGFRERALARMEGLIGRTRIVVIASHMLPLVTRLCNRVVWLREGKVVRDGDPEEVIAEYQKWILEASA